jgi:ubiquinone/menaquinone biosynthesis C-methylase UbiE
MQTMEDGAVDTAAADAYERFFVPAIFTPWACRLLRHAAPHPGERVLDVACGTGAAARQVAPLVGAEGMVMGVDVAPGMLAVARALAAPAGAAIEWREGEAGALPVPDGAFDLVLCQQGLQFFPDRAAAAREMRRALRDEGRAVLAVWKGLEHQPLYAALIEAEARHLGRPVSDFDAPFSLGEALDVHTVLAAGGFEHVQVVEETGTVRFPSADEFLERTMRASAAVIPAVQEMDGGAIADLLAALRREVEPVLSRYRDGDGVALPMAAHMAVARA